MTRKKIGRVLTRTQKHEYGVRDNPLPEKLSFLADIPFYAVTQCFPPDAIRNHKQTRVEILPRSLKKLVSAFQNEKKI